MADLADDQLKLDYVDVIGIEEMTAKQFKPNLRISEVVDLLSISADTLRYYEEISLLKAVQRMPSGIRCYQRKDISDLRFVQRAKTMNFSLNETSRLIKMRNDPQNARTDVRGGPRKSDSAISGLPGKK